MKTLFIVFTLCLISVQAQAKQYKKLTEIVNETVGPVADALNKSADNETLNMGGEFALRAVFLRIQAKAGFDVEFGKIELIPELELVFQKEKL